MSFVRPAFPVPEWNEGGSGPARDLASSDDSKLYRCRRCASSAAPPVLIPVAFDEESCGSAYQPPVLGCTCAADDEIGALASGGEKDGRIGGFGRGCGGAPPKDDVEAGEGIPGGAFTQDLRGGGGAVDDAARRSFVSNSRACSLPGFNRAWVGGFSSCRRGI